MRHAILILAHGDMEILKTNLEMLDDSRIDFYIHIDKKTSGDYSYLQDICKKSRVVLTKRYPIYWGDSNMLLAHLELLKNAAANNYDYYHMISGVDLSLRTPDELCVFFEKNAGKEFIHQWGQDFSSDERIRWRCRYKYPLLKYVNRRRPSFIVKTEKLIFMRLIRFPRKISLPSNWRLYVSEDWYSFTNGFVKQILDRESLLIDNFVGGVHVAEIAFITVLLNDPIYREKHSNEYTRYIDWERGKPYTWKIEDLSLLESSPCIFARKFSSSTDMEVVKQLSAHVMNRKK